MKESVFKYPDNIAPCPKCGRNPKIKVFGVNFARIECKPMFRKAHLSVFTDYHQPSKLMDAAAKAWNEAADCANLPVW